MGQPPGDLSDQYSAEVFYRFQLVPNLTLTPDLQLIFDPALDPDHERLLVFGLRMRVTFQDEQTGLLDPQLVPGGPCAQAGAALLFGF